MQQNNESDLNEEKKRIIRTEGNVLVTANPGTGKTKLLAHKYADLIRKGVPPESILCLTFTEKAKREMEERILNVLENKGIRVDLSKLNVHTFHAYSLDCIGERELVSSNLLRYSIYSYIKENGILNYNDDYIVDTLLPKIENSIRYLKSFGIKPDSIDAEKLAGAVEGTESIPKEDMEKFSRHFMRIYEHYEMVKEGRGIDYSDMLIKFLEIEKPKKYSYVLVDELQDVNRIEAEIALKSAEKFFVVGDKKQAIFGFQGGSTENFRLFSSSSKFVLTENFRSTNQILNYASSHFRARTGDHEQKDELEGLRNAEGKEGKKPSLYDIESRKSFPAACELAAMLEGKTAVITRTNGQILKLAEEMDARGMSYASTFFAASKDARMHVTAFIRGLMSNNPEDMKSALLTPFSPVCMRDVFDALSGSSPDADAILSACPSFRELRERVVNVEDINRIFEEMILPVAVGYGEEYLRAASELHNAYQEALRVIESLSVESLAAYLSSTDLLASEAEEGELVLTTVHKAKGREFDNVIYLPSNVSSSTGLVDNVVKAALEQKGLGSTEGAEEERLRIDFVAFTRAENQLAIITGKTKDYIDENAEIRKMEAEHKEAFSGNRMQRAYSLFVNGRRDEAEKELSREPWVREAVRKHFDNLDRISFSALPDKAYDYLVKHVLRVEESSRALSLGDSVHKAAQRMLNNEGVEEDEETRPYLENIKSMVQEIKKKYPKVYSVEEKFIKGLDSLGFDSKVKFKGVIDAVFTDGSNYLIVDWKTSRNDKGGAKHRQQLEAYKRLFSAERGIDYGRISVAVGYAGLRGAVNPSEISWNLDEKQPAKSSFGTFSKKVRRFLEWKDNVDEFFKALKEEKANTPLWKAVVEEWGG